MIKKSLILFLLVFSLQTVLAVCPVCTIAVGAGVGVLRAWGVDDVIAGLWFGALIVSSIAWMINWLNKKKIHFLFRKILVIVSFYALFIWPLYPMHILGNSINTILGIERLLFGVIIGSFVFIFSVLFNSYLKKTNNGEVIVYYQKVFIPLIFLSIASIIAYLLLKITGA
jgi:hypothetical protein